MGKEETFNTRRLSSPSRLYLRGWEGKKQNENVASDTKLVEATYETALLTAPGCALGG
jgi:hypothetical protein